MKTLDKLLRTTLIVGGFSVVNSVLPQMVELPNGMLVSKDLKYVEFPSNFKRLVDINSDSIPDYSETIMPMKIGWNLLRSYNISKNEKKAFKDSIETYQIMKCRG